MAKGTLHIVKFLPFSAYYCELLLNVTGQRSRIIDHARGCMTQMLGFDSRQEQSIILFSF
jgi:hypothetical protein